MEVYRGGSALPDHRRHVYTQSTNAQPPKMVWQRTISSSCRICTLHASEHVLPTFCPSMGSSFDPFQKNTCRKAQRLLSRQHPRVQKKKAKSFMDEVHVIAPNFKFLVVRMKGLSRNNIIRSEACAQDCIVNEHIAVAKTICSRKLIVQVDEAVQKFHNSSHATT